MASFFQKLFGAKQPKISLPGKEAISGRYLDFPGAQEAYEAYKGKIGIAPQMAQRYYEELYGPTAEAARAQWAGYVEPQITAQASARGLGRSSLVQDLLRRSVQERELGLARYGGELRTRGYETGLGEERFGITGLGDIAARSAQQEAARAEWERSLAERLYGAQRERYATGADIGRRIAGTVGGTILDIGTGGTSNWITELLRRLKSQAGTSPYLQELISAGRTPYGSTAFAGGY